MTRRRTAHRRASPELAMLSEINQRLVRIESNIDQVKEIATRNGAISGAVAGTVSGSLVATGIYLIKARLGLG
ncbi:hypothetical protein [Serratia fonticola]